MARVGTARPDHLVGRLDAFRERTARQLRRWWSLWPLVALVASLALAAAVIAVRDRTPLDATELSLIFGFGAGFAVYVQRAAVERRAHTIELLTALSTSQVLSPADLWMAERIADGHLPPLADLDTTERGHLVTLLDYYEFLCVLAAQEVLDRKVLLAMRGSAMASAYTLTRSYVVARRVATGNDALYVHLEQAADRVRSTPPTGPVVS